MTSSHILWRRVNGSDMAMPYPGALHVEWSDGDTVVLRPGDV